MNSEEVRDRYKSHMIVNALLVSKEMPTSLASWTATQRWTVTARLAMVYDEMHARPTCFSLWAGLADCNVFTIKIITI